MRYSYTIGVGCAVFACVLAAGLYVFTRTPPRDVSTVQTPRAPVVIPIQTIGTSVNERPIERFIFGSGDTRILFVGGMHGGYEWNSVLLAYRYIDYLSENPQAVPDGVTISVIPALNPDGVFRVTEKDDRFSENDVSKDSAVRAAGRFNANDVDLNRNFDCKWQSTGTWQSRTVSAGSSAFSEPESMALRTFILEFKPDIVVFWHSKANAVYASECENGILPETLAGMNAYAGASKYPAVTSFSAYPVSGDAEGWLASIGIPAITVELQTHESVEWERNLAGIDALISHLREATPQAK